MKSYVTSYTIDKWGFRTITSSETLLLYVPKVKCYVYYLEKISL